MMPTSLKWKVCGMRDKQNIQDVLSLQPDFMGFIFYPKSPRYVGVEFDEELLLSFPSSTKKVGVFVNHDFEELISLATAYKLDFLQLHGSESSEMCKKIQNGGFKVIKAFSVGDDFDFSVLESYAPFVDYFLFDTKAPGGYGGHGKSFDWSILKGYILSKPYFLAGGIDVENMQDLSQLAINPPDVLDVNSKFETEPGVKDIKKLELLKKRLNHFNNNSF